MVLIPPVNFALVVGEVYRSGHPIALNFSFLETMNLKTIVQLGDGASAEIAEQYNAWAASHRIKIIHLPLASVKEPFIETDPAVVEDALVHIADKRNHPILVHSDKGKHRVGLVMATLRKCFQKWSLASIYDEYIRFARGKADSDFLFIEQFVPKNEDRIAQIQLPKWVVS